MTLTHGMSRLSIVAAENNAPHYTIYGLVDYRDGKFFYVGRTKNLLRRLYQHSAPSLWQRMTHKRLADRLFDIRRSKGRRGNITEPILAILEETTDKKREDYHIRRLEKMGHELVNSYPDRPLANYAQSAENF